MLHKNNDYLASQNLVICCFSFRESCNISSVMHIETANNVLILMDNSQCLIQISAKKKNLISLNFFLEIIKLIWFLWSLVHLKTVKEHDQEVKELDFLSFNLDIISLSYLCFRGLGYGLIRISTWSWLNIYLSHLWQSILLSISYFGKTIVISFGMCTSY